MLTRIPVSMDATACYFVNGMESETSAIACGLRRRDPDLLDHLIEQYQHRLLRYLVSLTADRAIAEDLFQETWMRVLERGHQYDGRHEFSTWLYTIARNLTIDHLRRRRPAVSLDALMEAEDSALPYEPVSAGLSVLDTVAQHEVVERVTAAMSGLPSEYRETVVLRFQEGLGLEEIAALTKLPLGTVKSRLYRALNMLMNQLKGARV